VPIAERFGKPVVIAGFEPLDVHAVGADAGASDAMPVAVRSRTSTVVP
jgi:hypothetical protein